MKDCAILHILWFHLWSLVSKNSISKSKSRKFHLLDCIFEFQNWNIHCTKKMFPEKHFWKKDKLKMDKFPVSFLLKQFNNKTVIEKSLRSYLVND